MDPDHTQISATGSFYIITEQHPNLDIILLTLESPEWWSKAAADFKIVIDNVKHETAEAQRSDQVQTFI
jgi:hypothetical protein